MGEEPVNMRDLDNRLQKAGDVVLPIDQSEGDLQQPSDQESFSSQLPTPDPLNKKLEDAEEVKP